MAKHRPAHARSGLGRYTAPRRLHPAHAAASADGVRIVGLTGALVGGGLLASAGLMGIIATPAGATAPGAFVTGASPPFSSLGTTNFDGFGNFATVAGGGGTVAHPGEATAVAGFGDLDATNVDNTAFAFGFGPGNESIASAGSFGEFANLSGNSATANAVSAVGPLGGPPAGVAFAGAGDSSFLPTGSAFANASDNTAFAWTFGGFSDATAGFGDDANVSDNVAYAGSQFADVTSEAGIGADANLSGNGAYAYGLLAEFVGAYAGVGSDGHYENNLAVAQSTFGLAVACAGVEVFSVEGCDDGFTGGLAQPSDHIVGVADPGSNNMATAGSVAGPAEAFAVGGDNNTAAASAVGGGAGAALADGTGNSAAALGVAGGTTTAQAVGTDVNADATAVGAGSTATAVDVAGVSLVGATSALGGWSDASTSGGAWTVSINGGTLVS
ncbi:MAG TPA: hypothetical protein VN781_10140 [Acidimicrobiales bacterium]|nr:hypothetical protein [Acidimicrobiales bacterium]